MTILLEEWYVRTGLRDVPPALLRQVYDNHVALLCRVLELRDIETAVHAQQVLQLTLDLAQALGIGGKALVDLGRGALLHDIGKVGIPDAILHKPGPLTAAEWTIMRRHPQYACDLLTALPALRHDVAIPYCHHERWDGTGYPQGLADYDIPWGARIVAVVDVWDALCSDRPYRAAWPVAQVRAYIAALAGSHLDPSVVSIFLQLPAAQHAAPPAGTRTTAGAYGR